MSALLTRISKSGALAITGRMQSSTEQFPTRAVGWERVTRDPGRVRIGCARFDAAAEMDAEGEGK